MDKLEEFEVVIGEKKYVVEAIDNQQAKYKAARLFLAEASKEFIIEVSAHTIVGFSKSKKVVKSDHTTEQLLSIIGAVKKEVVDAKSHSL
jgi:hypothetical protein